MNRRQRFLGTILLTAAMLAPLTLTGCAAHVRFYDEYHSDYHHWDDREDRAYRSWLGERHYEYREYKKLNHDEQHDYWNWRHEHPDTGR